MDRTIVYPSSIPQDTDILNTNIQAMIGLGKLAGAVFGGNGLVNGLTVTPQSPASMSVNVAPGEIYSLQNIDNTPYGSLQSNTVNTVVKQGIQLNTVALACPAPTTSGYSINYLIEAAFQESDINDVVLPYYNAANPTQAYAGPGNNAQAQATTRAGQVNVQAKPGVATTTGSQTTPTLDAGFVPLAVVTVAYGAASITSANITVAQGSMALPASLINTIQTNAANYGLDTGVANAYAVAYLPAVLTLVDGMKLTFKVKNTNTAAATLVVNNLPAYPIVTAGGAAINAGQIIAGTYVTVTWNATSSQFMATAGFTIGTVTAVTVTNANGVSATVANQGTTPALTVALGAITPSSITCSGAITALSMDSTSSDRRLKRNIRKVEPRPLHRKIPFVTFERKIDGSIGFGAIAQIVEKIEPAYVGHFEMAGKQRLSLDYKSMAYELAVWCGRELDQSAKVIAAQAKALKKLESRLAKLERRA